VELVTSTGDLDYDLLTTAHEDAFLDPFGKVHERIDVAWHAPSKVVDTIEIYLLQGFVLEDWVKLKVVHQLKSGAGQLWTEGDRVRFTQLERMPGGVEFAKVRTLRHQITLVFVDTGGMRMALDQCMCGHLRYSTASRPPGIASRPPGIASRNLPNLVVILRYGFSLA
jgi:hypothetical protein